MTLRLTDWTLVIDLDGTLVETAPDLHAALNHVLQGEGLDPIPLAEIRNMIGDGAKALIKKGMSWNGISEIGDRLDTQLWPDFLDHYLRNICRLSRPFEGALEALDVARTQGAQLAICTNKTQRLAEAVLDGLEIRDRFAAVLGADHASARKPSPVHILETIEAAGGRADKAVMIGDSQTDQQAALNAGLPYIFAEFGYGTVRTDGDAQLAHLAHWAELGSALRTLIRS